MSLQYRFAGVTVASEITLPLPVVDPDSSVPVVAIRRARSETRVAENWARAREVLPLEADAGPGAMTVRLIDGDYLLRVAGVVDLVYRPENHQLVVEAPPGQGSNTIEHVLLDQALPRLLALQGHLMLHASAVAVEGRAYCFVGPSGAGKSTVAALLFASGLPVLADDAIRLRMQDGVPWVDAAYPSLRLWDDSAQLLPEELLGAGSLMAEYSPKTVYRIEEWRTGRSDLPLGGIYLLEPGEQEPPQIGLAPPASALIRIMGQTFSLHPGVPHIEAERLSRMSSICSACRPKALRFSHLRDQRARLVAALKASIG